MLSVEGGFWAALAGAGHDPPGLGRGAVSAPSAVGWRRSARGGFDPTSDTPQQARFRTLATVVLDAIQCRRAHGVRFRRRDEQCRFFLMSMRRPKIAISV